MGETVSTRGRPSAAPTRPDPDRFAPSRSLRAGAPAPLDRAHPRGGGPAALDFRRGGGSGHSPGGGR
eukprot:8248288-Pyramimonas_sp.AAC.1